MLSGDWIDAEKFAIVDGYVVLRNTGSYASAAMSGFAIEDFIDMKATSLPIVFDYAKKTSAKKIKKTSAKPSYQPRLLDPSVLRFSEVRKHSPDYYRSLIKEFYTIPITYTRRTHDEINCTFCGCLHNEDGDECGDCVIARNTAVDYTLKWVAETDNVFTLLRLADLIRHYNITRGISIIRGGNWGLYIWYIDNTNMWASIIPDRHYYGFSYWTLERYYITLKPKRPVSRLDKSWK